MQDLKLRSGASETAHKTQPRTPKASSLSPESSESRVSRILERRPSNKTISSISSEKRSGRVSEMQQQLVQLQEELKKAKGEKTRAFGELADLKKGTQMQSQKNEGKKRIEDLEVEVEKAKESERKMLESLVFQTKQLEQTKISLEEAKLEIRTLQESIRTMKGSDTGKSVDKNGSINDVRAQEQIAVLRNELNLATQGEEKSRNAMEDLATTLKEVAADANQAKGRLACTQSELEKVTLDAERTKSLLKMTEEKYRAAMEESDRIKVELEESLAAWTAKENSFINCMKVSEEEIGLLKQENDRLIDSQRASREDISKLRDILKQAVNEATIVKEALEIARKENSQLKDLLSEKENALQSIKQEYECLKVSEAAALDSVRELKSLLAATSNVDSNRTISTVDSNRTVSPVDSNKIIDPLENEPSRPHKGVPNLARGSKSITEFPSDRWRAENPRILNGRRHSVGASAKFRESTNDTDQPLQSKSQILASVSNVTESRITSSLFTDYGESMHFDDFENLDRNNLVGMDHEHGSPPRLRKKKPMLRRFGDMLRRRSFHK